nr:MAG TPA: hypothetical protein [Microviridae sp.]
MGWFGEALQSGLKGGLASGISGAIGGLIGNIGYGNRLKKQVNAQKQLNEQAAKLNYEYGEKAAENAYQRQMEMYERSYQDQSYSAMRQQMEDAGLSVGLMYGGSGSGGAGGATTGAPQGETGGAEAGRADGPAAQQTAAIQQAQLGLGLVSMKKDLAIKDAQIEEINATAARQRAEAENLTQKSITEVQQRDWIVRGAKEIAHTHYIDRLRKEYEDTQPAENGEDMEWNDAQFGAYKIVYEGMRNQETRVGVLEAISRTNKNDEEKNAAKALARLNNTKADGYWRELQIELIKGNALAAMAAAQKLNAEMKKMDLEHKYGYKMGPMQWIQLGKDGAEFLLSAVNMLMGRKAGAAMAKTTKRMMDGKSYTWAQQ